MSAHRILYHHRIRAEDGQAVHVREMISALRAAGHEVLEVALVPKGNGTGVADSNGSRFWKKLRLPRIATECTETLYSRRGGAMILKAAKEFQPDFIYERYALHCRAGLLAARQLRKPLILEVNSPLVEEMQRLGLLYFKQLAQRTECELLRSADRVLPVSQVLARRLTDLGAPADRVRVVRNGADPARFDAASQSEGRRLRADLGLGNGQFLLGFIGYMRPWHRLDLVLDAMAGVSRDELHFLMIGVGPALPDLMRRASALGLSDRVHAIGTVAGADIPAACAAFDVAMVPSINDYASPLKMFDSLSAGVATLALDQPNIRELIADGETGVLFAPGDVASLRERLDALAADRERTAAIGRAGRESLLANDWTWRGSAGRVIGAYEELAGELVG